MSWGKEYQRPKKSKIPKLKRGDTIHLYRKSIGSRPYYQGVWEVLLHESGVIQLTLIRFNGASIAGDIGQSFVLRLDDKGTCSYRILKKVKEGG